MCIGRKQDVGWFDIPMHDSAVMRVIQRIRHLTRDLERLLDAQLSFAFQLLLKRLALDVRRDAIEATARFSAVE